MIGKHTRLLGVLALGLGLATTTALAQQNGQNVLKNQGDQAQPSSVGSQFGAQNQGQGSAPPASDDAEQAAMRKAIQRLGPLLDDPQKIRQFRQMLNRARQAQSEPVEPVEPRSRSVRLQLEPGEAPPEVRLVQGHVSTITFADVTGKPWPIQSVTSGNPKAFAVKSAGKKKNANVLTVSPQTAHGQSNLSVKLVDHPVPVTLTLQAGTGTADYRMNIKVASRGPNASYDRVQANAVPATDDKRMLKFLDGLPPQGAERLDVTARSVEAWVYNGKMYVRTPHEVLSPTYRARSRSPSGMNVYRMSRERVLLLSRGGEMHSVTVKN